MAFYKKISLFFVIIFLSLLAIAFYFSLHFFQYTKNTLPDINADSVSVSLLSGKATNVAYTIRGYLLPIGNVIWQVDIASLFRLALCMRFYSDSEKTRASGRLCLNGLDKKMTIQSAIVSIAASEISEITGVMLEGYFQGKIDLFELHNVGIKKISGDIAWRNANFYNGERWLALGDIQLEVDSPEPSVVIVQWSDRKDDTLSPQQHIPDIDIYMQTVFKNGRFFIAQGTINPVDRYDPALLYTLQLIATQQTDGSFIIDR